MMDMTESIIPRSDQINADDLIAGPITYTVREVIAGAAEQPFDFMLVETDRAYRPSKTMRRVIVNAWGSEAANYAGRRLSLYREPTIKFGGQEVGGIRISHMSHIEGPVEVMAQTTRGKREKFTVQPLGASDEPARVSSPVVGGLILESQEDALALIRALSAEQLAVIKRMLDIEGTTTKPDLAAALLEQKREWDSQDVLAELAGWATA